MTRSEIEKAERYSRTRSIMMALMAAILLFNAATGLGDEIHSERPNFDRRVASRTPSTRTGPASVH